MKIVCVGDCGVDRYVHLGLDRPGGITLNFAVNARRCFQPDARITILTTLGTDEGARLVSDALSAAGVDACVTRLEGRTPIQYIDLEPSGEKRFVGYDAGVLARYRMAPREREIIAGSDLLVTTVFAQAEGLFASVMACPSQGLRAVDFTDLSDVADGAGLVSRYLDRLDLGFFGLRASETELIDTLERLARDSGRLFIVTLAADGSLALGGRRRVGCPAVPVARVVDTTGAGDAFAAGFLSEFCESADVPRSLARGSREAARAIQHLGAVSLDQ